MARGRGVRSSKQHDAYPTCVRHLQPRKDVRLRHFFLCDACAEKWTNEAFAGNKPLYEGDQVNGYCQLCNVRQVVRLHTWFLCDICDRVARSIGRNHVAEQAILDFWRKSVQSRFPYLVIEQNDPSALRPRRTTDATGEGPLDFLVRDTRSRAVVLGIENKTGRSSIRDMSAFQLDVSDCDSILHHVRELSIPAYVIHAQVLELWEPPTQGYQTVGLWWSDIYQMTGHFREIRMRRDEQRGAAYFSKRAFQSIETLSGALVNNDGELALVATFRQRGVPQMYQTD